MSEQIGVMVASEPQPLSTENIEQMMEWTYGITPPDVYQAAQGELAAIHRLTVTDEAAEWVDLAALHDAEIKRLLAANADLTAKLEDLHDKHVAAQEELHDLRIKKAIVLSTEHLDWGKTVDWGKAPAWAHWWTLDSLMNAQWWKTEPTRTDTGGWVDGGRNEQAGMYALTWKSVKLQCPQGAK